LPVADYRDVGEKPVAAASDGLDEAWILGGIAQSFSNLADCFVEAVIEIHDCLRPKSTAQFLPGDQLSRFFQQDCQQLEGLLLQPESFAMLRQLAGSNIGIKDPKPQTLGRVLGVHDGPHTSHELDPPCGASRG
jgi:hypothetical protein